MIKLHLSIPIFIVLLFSSSLQAQLVKPIIPYSVTCQMNPLSEFTVIENKMSLKSVETEHIDWFTRTKKQTFAFLSNVRFSPDNSGEWQNTSSGKVWRLGIRSEGAYSIYEVFGKFYLREGVSLFVYNVGKTDFAGPYTCKNNNKNNLLAIPPVSGEAIIIELNIPGHIDEFGELELTEVWHDYKNFFGNKTKLVDKEPEVTCNTDINCPIGAGWQNEKNAVCRLLSNGQLCTGTLVTNTANNKVPFLLTACHCVEDSLAAASAIFFFGYEREQCNKTGIEKSFAIAGAELLATTSRQLDFSLLKLNAFPPVALNPYLAGWDAEEKPPLGGACIHHPDGSVKKISVENDRLITGDFGEGFDSNSHWIVSRWESGSTTGGSSGAPFFDKSHRLIGTLSGGDATCANPVNDFFVKLNLCWDYYPNPENQLKHWLDPTNTGIRKTNGSFLFEEFHFGFSTYSNYQNENFELIQNHLSWGVISGHNSSGYSRFAEKFENAGLNKIKGIYLNIKDRYFSDIFSTFTIKIWEGKDYPVNEIYSEEVYYRTVIRSADNYYYFDSAITVSGTFFAGYEINYNFPDTLMVNTISNRLFGRSTMYIFDGMWHNINEVTFPVVNTSLAIGVIGSKEMKPEPLATWPLKIAPNPCNDYMTFTISENLLPLSISCFDYTGRQYKLNYEVLHDKVACNTAHLPTGVYMLVVNTAKGRWSGLFEVLRY